MQRTKSPYLHTQAGVHKKINDPPLYAQGVSPAQQNKTSALYGTRVLKRMAPSLPLAHSGTGCPGCTPYKSPAKNPKIFNSPPGVTDQHNQSRLSRTNQSTPKIDQSKQPFHTTHPRGRPPQGEEAYRADIPERAFELALLGLTDAQLAIAFGVTTTTIDQWKRIHPHFLERLTAGKEQADAHVVRSLYQRACGYAHPDVHVTAYRGEVTVTPYTHYYPPDTYACLRWLAVRQRTRWGIAAQTDIMAQVTVQRTDLAHYTDTELAVIERLGLRQLVTAQDN